MVTRENIARKFALDPDFQGLSQDRQKAVFEEATRRISVPEQSVSLEQLQNEVQPTILGSQKLADIFVRPGAAVRSALRGQGFTEGAINPQNVPTFQQRTLEQFVPRTPSTLINFLGGMFPSAAGLSADIAMNPMDILGLLAGKLPVAPAQEGETALTTLGDILGKTRPIQALGRFGTKERYIPFSEGSKLRKEALTKTPELISDLMDFQKGDLQTKLKSLRSIRKTANEMSSEQLQQFVGMTKEQLSSLESQLTEASRKATLEAQIELPSVFKQKSDEFGEMLQNLYEKATGRTGVKPTIRSGDLYSTLRNVAQEGDLIGVTSRTSLSPSENAILGYMEKLSNPETFNEPIEVGDALRIIRDIRKTAPRNAPYSSGEHILSRFQEEMSGLLEDKIPGIGELRRNYAPFIDFKKKAFRVIKPFSGEYGADIGTNFFKRISLGKPTGDDLALAEALKNETGIDFSAHPSAIGKQIQILRKTTQQAKPTIQSFFEPGLKKTQELGGEAIKSSREVMSSLERDKALYQEAGRQLAGRRQALSNIGRSLAYGAGMGLGSGAGLYYLLRGLFGMGRNSGGYSE